MPIIKSAKKRVRTARKATIRNAKTRRSLKSAIKSLSADIDSKKSKSAESFSRAQSEIDRAVKKGVIHKNKAARKKKQLAAKAKAVGVKIAGSAKAKSKPAATKKPVAKKSPAKKPAAKKSSAKKTTAKK